jgi:hydroxymethylpyrimidine kinase/phosphomethylpyrimidine kinase/thiamine-phosphate diphosphorylase
VLLPLGVKTLQLRIKNKQGLELENEIKRSIMLAEKYQANLFINDYWEMAIRYGAYGVHLGQEDLETADMTAIRQAELRLGISTHCYYEVARAHALNPSYIACGPIFTTTSKVMSFAAQGIAQLKRWRRTLNYPLVAIGGINAERIPDVLATKVDGIAMISAITQAKDPIATTKSLMNVMEQYVTNDR